MVMQYLVSRNEEYLRHIAKLNQEIGEILEILEVLQYNILELKTQLNQLETSEDAYKKEEWFAKQQKKI
tara:strand:- start:305 stop:511 length:207 start_codon:yes stop_codon:yes gene_type:complete